MGFGRCATCTRGCIRAPLPPTPHGAERAKFNVANGSLVVRGARGDATGGVTELRKVFVA